MKLNNAVNFIKTETMIELIGVVSPDLKQTVGFYSGLLGLEIHEAGPGKAAFQLGETRLEFIEDPTIEPVYHMAFDIPRNMLQEALDWFATRLEVLPLPDGGRIINFANWNAESFYFFDSTGNLLECIVHHDRQEEASGAFSAEQLLRVSELGIVTEHVPTLVEKLETEHGLLPFVKQPVLENFAAIGDETGLLILSQEGRNWFPTQLPAKPFYWKLKMSEKLFRST